MTRKPTYRDNNGQLYHSSVLDIARFWIHMKKVLKQTDSLSCPDCEMDPQDVPRLFNCTAHPKDLSKVNLWDMPVNTIRELTFLDQGNMD